MYKITIYLILSLVSSIVVFGQTKYGELTGQITDSISKKGLPNASIKVASKNNGKVINGLSNDNGKFIFNRLITGIYSLSIEYVGYSSVRIDSVYIDSLNRSTKLPPISLRLLQKELVSVTVKSIQPFIVQMPDKIILNVAESPIAAGGNAYDILLRAPGVIEQNGDLNFRGRSVRIYINNRPSNITGEDLKNMLSGMPANSIERVEVLPNPSAKYDAQGGSIINIVLAKNKNYGANYTISTGVGQGRYTHANGGIDINYRNKKINIYGGYNYMYNKQYYDNNSIRYLSTSNILTNEYDVRNRNNNSYKLGTDYDINKSSTIGFLINGYISTRERNVESNLALKYLSNIYDSSSKVLTKGVAKFLSPSLNIYYRTILDSTGKELSINVDYFFLQKYWNETFGTYYYNKIREEYLSPTFLRDNSPAQTNVYSFSADYTKPNKSGRWEAGVKIARTITDNDIEWQQNTNSGNGWLVDTSKTNHFIYKENIGAAYINYICTIKKFKFQLGLRGEQTNTEGNSITLSQINNKNYFNLFPNVSLGYTKDMNNIFNFSYRKSIVRFGLNVVNPFIIYQNQYSYYQGNPNIEPQINHIFSSGYVFKQLLNVELDYVHADKMLTPIFKNGNGNVVIQTLSNISSGNVGILAVSITKKIGFWTAVLSNTGGYSIYKLPDSTSNQQNSKGWLFYSQLQNNLNFKKGLTGEISCAYSAPMVYAAYNIHQVFKTDVGISKNLFGNKVSLKLSVTDVFNSLKQVMYYNAQSVNMNQNNKAESRFINLVIKYKFGNKNVKAKTEKQSKINDIKGRLDN